MCAPFRRRDEGIDVLLPGEIREFLSGLATEMRDLETSGSGDDDPGLARLKPSAYPDDPGASMAFDELAGGELARGRAEALDILQRTSSSDRLTLEEADAWVRTLNDARLVLGTRLQVTEESTEQDFPDADMRRVYGLYTLLGYLVDMLVEALDV